MCDLCVKYPAVAVEIADRMVLLTERYAESLAVLRLHGIDEDEWDEPDEGDVFDDRFDVIERLMDSGEIYDCRRPHRFRGSTSGQPDRLPPVSEVAAGNEDRGVPAVPGGGRGSPGGGDGGVPEDAAGPADGGGGRPRRRRPSGAGQDGLFAVGRWLPRARFAPWQAVALPPALGGGVGEVMSVAVSGGARVYRVLVGFAGVAEVAEYLLRECESSAVPR